MICWLPTVTAKGRAHLCDFGLDLLPCQVLRRGVSAAEGKPSGVHQGVWDEAPQDAHIDDNATPVDGLDHALHHLALGLEVQDLLPRLVQLLLQQQSCQGIASGPPPVSHRSKDRVLPLARTELPLESNNKGRCASQLAKKR